MQIIQCKTIQYKCNIVQRSSSSKGYLLNTFIQQGCIKWIKSDSNKSNDFYIVSKKSISNSEGSCDTEDWNNDAGNSALHHKNTLHFKTAF